MFPKNPKLIFTSSLNFFDEIFKIYAACQMNKNKPIFIGQHEIIISVEFIIIICLN